MKRISLFTLAALLSPLVHADADIEALVTMAARSGSAVESILYNRPVVAVPLQTRPCLTVGVISLNLDDPRIDNFKVCAGAPPQAIKEVSPALPEDAEFKELTIMTIRAALRHGMQQRSWQDYRIDTRRLTPVAEDGCAEVETTIATLATPLVVSYQVGRRCP